MAYFGRRTVSGMHSSTTMRRRFDGSLPTPRIQGTVQRIVPLNGRGEATDLNKADIWRCWLILLSCRVMLTFLLTFCYTENQPNLVDGISRPRLFRYAPVHEDPTRPSAKMVQRLLILDTE